MADKLIKNRIVFLTDEITRQNAMEVCKQLMALETENKEHIILYINSGGGFLYQAFAIIDTIDLLKKKGCDVYTVATGVCATSASLILCCGVKRYVTSNCRVVLHESSATKSGRITDLRIEMQESEIVLEKAVEVFSEKTRKSVEDIYKILERNKYMSATEAIEFGLVDMIYSS